jgi:hypothetical protein
MGLVIYIFINKIKSYCFDVQETLKTRCRLVGIACTGGILLFFLSIFFFFFNSIVEIMSVIKMYCYWRNLKYDNNRTANKHWP